MLFSLITFFAIPAFSFFDKQIDVYANIIIKRGFLDECEIQFPQM